MYVAGSLLSAPHHHAVRRTEQSCGPTRVWEARNVRCIEQTQGCCPARVVMVKRYEFLVERCCDGVDEFLQCGEGGNSGVVLYDRCDDS